MRYQLRCLSCGTVFSSSKTQTCPKCGGLLEVEYKGKINLKLSSTSGFWDLEPLMPNGKYRHYEVGFTKLIESHESKDLLLKLEFENPTRSFKDRGSVIEVAKANEYGYNEIVCASTGNMAYSISYFAKLFGLRATVFISKGANKDKLFDIRSTHDAELHLINGDFTKAQQEAAEYAQRHSAFLAGDYCYRKEGQSTIGFELFAQNAEIENIIMPIGNGTLFSAVYKAYSRLVAMHIAKRVPKLIGVQASSSAPIVHAKGGVIKYERPRTLADAIAVGYPTYGKQVLEAVEKTNGLLLTVTDKEMIAWQRRFYQAYGIQVELAAVASLAAYAKIKSKLKGKTAALITGANL
ncbi:MAG: threonine synthase [Candidatus Micrarchaeia archaeon]